MPIIIIIINKQFFFSNHDPTLESAATVLILWLLLLVSHSNKSAEYLESSTSHYLLRNKPTHNSSINHSKPHHRSKLFRCSVAPLQRSYKPPSHFAVAALRLWSNSIVTLLRRVQAATIATV
ncbi:hypothetical protein HanRHA438_Chr02g0066031 [Helianthus annuus]|uniref:Uncharacterized protein n=1 Tax=Helianthus annuus TaxID=4232 RepID=A0A9K3JNZ1_HELAN|nr:hypothetical protein HanXRQr2_Chr02g0064781 [Helianthus annuus]KAJ0939856.1 hypothetical protein HanRHA438_Chr02g0066031 [Helianthus annuus]